MNSEKKRPAYRILLLITTPKLAKKATDLFNENQIPVQYNFRAQGTASSEIMNLLGLGSIEKTVLLSEMPKTIADDMLMKLRKQLHLGMQNSGVAFTIAISGSNYRMVKMMETLYPETDTAERKEWNMSENSYSMIMAIVDQGFSEDVMNAARPIGASGGTVFHSRRVGSEEALRFWGISVQQEREIVIILTPRADKMPIMEAINKDCGMHSPAHGVVLSVPVDGVVGID